jgi:hypothetical protein
VLGLALEVSDREDLVAAEDLLVGAGIGTIGNCERSQFFAAVAGQAVTVSPGNADCDEAVPPHPAESSTSQVAGASSRLPGFRVCRPPSF